MKSKTIKVFAMHCCENSVYKGRIEEIENTLEAKQKFVGGTIQNIEIDGVDIICNDDGKLIGLPLNRVLVDEEGNVLDIFVGDILACNHNAEGDYTDIKDDDIPKLIKYLKPIEYILGSYIFCSNEENLDEFSI